MTPGGRRRPLGDRRGHDGGMRGRERDTERERGRGGEGDGPQPIIDKQNKLEWRQRRFHKDEHDVSEEDRGRRRPTDPDVKEEEEVMRSSQVVPSTVSSRSAGGTGRQEAEHQSLPTASSAGYDPSVN